MASLIHPGYAQQLVSQGYGGYAGWGDDEAFADFQATKGSGKQTQAASPSSSDQPSNQPVNDPTGLAQQLIDRSAQNQIKANQAFKDYRASNPFTYDEYLSSTAMPQAKEQLDPYYNESLSDYLLGVTRKTQRSQADTRDLLGELAATSESYGRDTQLKLTETMNKARQGFANVGLFESGARFREAEGLPTTVAQNEMTDFTRRQDLRRRTAETGLGRTLEDISLAKKQDVRNLERERFTETGTLARRLTGEAGQQYVSGFQQTLPPELQANTNFDMLKQLGVYS